MTLNGDKFEHHRIGKNLGLDSYSYKDSTEENIIEKEYIKDLEVYISSNLTWSKQLKRQCQRPDLC